MDYSTPHFGKSLNDLTYSDIEIFFHAEKIETDLLEFKSVHPSGSLDEKFAGIRRSACAFLNSGGGLIIWGAPGGTKVTGKTEKVFTGPLSPHKSILEKDAVVSKICDAITPLPSGIRAKIVDNGTDCVVVIEVDQSDYSPHETGHAYFMRIDGQTKPAPHHYIEALFRKVKYPNLEGYVRIVKCELDNSRGNSVYAVTVQLSLFNWSPLQNEEAISFRLLANGGVFAEYDPYISIPQGVEPRFRYQGAEYFKNNVKNVFYYGEPLTEAMTINYNPHAILNHGNKAILYFSFGGRFSPLKTSEYILNFSHFQQPNYHLLEPNRLIESMKENRQYKDMQDEAGMTKEKILKDWLR